MHDNDNGWSWFVPGKEATPPEPDRDLALAFARCFRGADGERVLAHLRAMTLEQALGPTAGEALLRHLEGQRQLVAHILGLVGRGRGDGTPRPHTHTTMENGHE